MWRRGRKALRIYLAVVETVPAVYHIYTMLLYCGHNFRTQDSEYFTGAEVTAREDPHLAAVQAKTAIMLIPADGAAQGLGHWLRQKRVEEDFRTSL